MTRVSSSLAASLAVVALLLAGVHGDEFSPGTVHFSQLVDDELFERSGAKAVISEELKRTGVIQVTGIPKIQNGRKAMLAGAARCAPASAGAKSSTFPDGTTRTTLASKWSSEDGHLDFAPHGHGEALCAEFDAASSGFRTAVAEATQAFAHRVGSLFPGTNAAQQGQRFGSFAEFHSASDQLEHFHHYQSGASAKTESDQAEERTLPMHTDMGLFIAFTPAVLMGANSEPETADGFWVEMRDGTQAQVSFADDGDVLVFMLGDGAMGLHDELRPAPHAFHMSKNDNGMVRSWYGRMVVAPGVGSVKHDDQNAHTVCSEGHVRRVLSSESDCTEDQLFCWHRCQNLTEVVNEQACEAQNLTLQCADASGQIWNPAEHRGPDYIPRCEEALVSGSPTPAPSSAANPGVKTSVLALATALAPFVL